MIQLMLTSRQRDFFVAHRGFALPTLLIASVVMMTVLLSAVSATSGVRVVLNEQYFRQLASEAAEAGQARAEACLAASSYTATWTSGSPLRPDTTCTGSTISGGNRYIIQSGLTRTTFSVAQPTTGAASSAKVTVTGTTELLRKSSNVAYKTFSQTLVRNSRYASSPKVTGGAGWKGVGHLGVVLTADNKLYGFGANNRGQISDSQSPASVLVPTAMVLPPGVSSVTSVQTSGQGATFVCIMANTAQVWCRGAAGAGEDGLLPAAVGWQRFGLPAGLTAVSMSVSGYGPDAMCVLASDNQAYCAGESYYGSLGNNNTAYTIYKIDNPQRFRLDIPAPGASLRKIVTESNITCGITTTNVMYCAGVNFDGQIAGPLTNGTGNGSYGAPIRYPIPGARTIDDVSMTYHTTSGSAVLHALATDGTIWSSGAYNYGDLGNGSTTGATGSSQVPALFTHTDARFATGSVLLNAQSNKCMDNDANQSANGNKIQLWDCASTGNNNQTWVYGKNKQLTNLGTGKCLDVPGNNQNPGTRLQLYTCNGTSAQQFNLVGANTIVNAGSGLCVDALNSGTSNGTVLQMWTCSGGGAQSFTASSSINGWRGMVTGTNHFCGIRSDDYSGMWCAGQNNHGQLANWATAGNSFMGQCQNAPATGHNIFNVNLPNGEKVDVTRLSDEWRSQFLSTMIISTTGKVYGAGRNEFGKLGNGTVGASGSDFRECVTKEFILPAGVTAVDMSTRDEYTTYVLGSNGRIYAAGRNNLGQLGDGSVTNRTTPVESKIPRQAVVY